MGLGAAPLKDTIERFIASCQRPFLCEPGEDSLAITGDNVVVEARNGAVSLQAWDERRNLVRRVVGIQSEQRGRLTLHIERFGKRPGTLSLVDLSRPRNQSLTVRGTRQDFREDFRRFLRRQFPDSKIADISTEANLEDSLSPIYPRALLKRGASAWAAIGASADDAHADGILSFGLIWLDYLRRRDPDLVVHGLVLYLPAGQEKTTCLRLPYLDPEVARHSVFTYSGDGAEFPVDLRDYGNLDTRLEPCRRRLPSSVDETIARWARVAGVERIERHDGEISLRVRGIEFARTSGEQLLAGIETKRVTGASNATEVENLARELGRLRSPDASDRLNPLYLRNRELWLESQVRAEIEQIDASLRRDPIYGQVPAFAAADRGVIDLLGVDVNGRLAIIELKASEDIHLPFQALDYWMRVKWHLDRGEFTKNGYFPGMELRPDAPRMLLISPSLDVHPTNERILRCFSPSIPIEHIGVGIEWQKKLKVMFRVNGQCQ
jgi:hypothetical protein